jgi:hypothetical protein
MSAAWSGNVGLVRLLLHFGGDHRAVGQSHFSGGIKVRGPRLDAAGWAESRGFTDVAALLRSWASADPGVVAKIRLKAAAAAKAAAKAAATAPALALSADATRPMASVSAFSMVTTG